MIDGTLLGGDLVTLRATGLHRQSTPLSADQLVANVDGVPRRVFTTSQGRLVLVTESAETTKLGLYDRQIEVVEPPVFSDGFE